MSNSKSTKKSSASTSKATNKNYSNAKWIKGFEGQYKITPSGQVISYKKSEKGTPLKPRKNNSGYLCVDLRTEGSHNERYIHKLVAQHFISNRNPKKNPQVAFKDGNRQNVNSSNLIWSNRTLSNQMAKERNSKRTNKKNVTSKTKRKSSNNSGRRK